MMHWPVCLMLLDNAKASLLIPEALRQSDHHNKILKYIGASTVEPSIALCKCNCTSAPLDYNHG